MEFYQVLPLWVMVDLGVMGIEQVLYIPQSSRTGASLSDAA